MVVWAFTMCYNPETKYTEIFTQAGDDWFPGADNIGCLLPSKMSNHFKGPLGGMGYVTTYHGPVSSSREKLSFPLCLYIRFFDTSLKILF